MLLPNFPEYRHLWFSSYTTSVYEGATVVFKTYVSFKSFNSKYSQHVIHDIVQAEIEVRCHFSREELPPPLKMLGNYPDVRKPMINVLFRQVRGCFLLKLGFTEICKKIPPKIRNFWFNCRVDEMNLNRYILKELWYTLF